MDLIPFSELNRAFVQKLADPELHRGKFSFLKVLQHGLAYSMLSDEKKIVRNYLALPVAVIRFIYWMKSAVRKTPHIKKPLRRFVVIDEGRAVPDADGKLKSIYFDRIVPLTGRQQTTIISKRKADADFDFDFLLSELPQANAPLDRWETEMLSEIKTCLVKINARFTAHEARYMQSALHVFFESFRFWHRQFSNQPVRACLFCVHYHNEGLIAALKIHRIKSIEVQHGLIANNDFYYVYDKEFAHCTPRAFFPDHILLYGNYWKRILLNGSEWKPEQLVVAGDYLYRLNKPGHSTATKENIILIGAQKNVPQQYVQYTAALQNLLKEKHADWRIVVKIHPLEKDPRHYYDHLAPLGVQVVGSEVRLDDLLAVCKIQISISSTTFFDALGFDVVNFSLQHFTMASDYAADMVRESVALPLGENEDPIERYLALQETDFKPMPRGEVYSGFDPQAVLAVL